MNGCVRDAERVESLRVEIPPVERLRRFHRNPLRAFEGLPRAADRPRIEPNY